VLRMGTPQRTIKARARQLGGGLADGLVRCGISRGSEAHCAQLDIEWLVCSITTMQRCGSGSACTIAAGRSLGEAMARCAMGQGGRGDVRRQHWV
jgi:hypothetical protein